MAFPGCDDLWMFRAGFAESPHGPPIFFINGECLFDLVLCDDFAENQFQFVPDSLYFTDRIFHAGLQGSVLRISHGDGRRLWHSQFHVLDDALHGIAESGDDDSFQHVIGSPHGEFYIGPHDGTAKALQILVSKLDFCPAAPHADRYAACSVDDFFRCMNGETSYQFFPSLFFGVHNGFAWMQRRSTKFLNRIQITHSMSPFLFASLFSSIISSRPWILVSYCASEKTLGSVWSPSKMTDGHPVLSVIFLCTS